MTDYMTDFLRQQLPRVRTQAQFDAAAGAFEAARLMLNAIVDGDKEREAESRKVFEVALEAVGKASRLADQLEAEPEAASSPAAEAFKRPPAQFEERELQTQLLGELGAITDADALGAWYEKTKALRDRVVSQGLRNELLDAVRAKRRSV